MHGDGDERREDGDRDDDIAHELDHEIALAVFAVCEAMHMPNGCAHAFKTLCVLEAVLVNASDNRCTLRAESRSDQPMPGSMVASNSAAIAARYSRSRSSFMKVSAGKWDTTCSNAYAYRPRHRDSRT